MSANENVDLFGLRETSYLMAHSFDLNSELYGPQFNSNNDNISRKSSIPFDEGYLNEDVGLLSFKFDDGDSIDMDFIKSTNMQNDITR